MRHTIYRHPLAALRGHLGLSATEYLTLLDQRHRALNLGAMAIRREKVCRWESGLYAPEPSAQLAMADLHAVPAATVASRDGRTGCWPLLPCAAGATTSFSEARGRRQVRSRHWPPTRGETRWTDGDS
jgi:hypothetical protein